MHQSIRITGVNEHFEVVNDSELKNGDIFFGEKDYLFTWENGDLYLDYQCRVKTPHGSQLVDGGGILLASFDTLANYDETEDIDEYGCMKNEIFASLDYANIYYSAIGYKIFTAACDMVREWISNSYIPVPAF
ncbi:MAG: hypothetical protein IJG38_00160 [Thermoguttaceae bacterium]|nr:hypothetical protein [Thermoguttaceae bacterium]MBQ3348788.1 hypothetical protein [Thermoguttaceae bacterium]